jgi:3'-(hydroxy)phthioceranyl-2'-palmitoyl(stearoyl)-2-O-sulfo-trehalose (hydroxy)phthioceranyltransferase
MRLFIRSAGVVLIAIAAAVLLALTTTMTSALAATALMIGGIGVGTVPDSVMSSVLKGAYTGHQRKSVNWSGSPNLGQSIPEAANILDQEIDEALAKGESVTVVGMSAGSLAVEEVLRRRANDPANANLTFVVIADSGRQPFFTGAGSPLSTLFGYVFRAPAETPYNVIVVVHEYDGLSDLPDRLWNGLAMANAMAGAVLFHNATFFADLSKLPATSTRNSKGGLTTSYLIPAERLPLVQLMPWLAPMEETLRQQVDAGYTRNDQAAVTSSPFTALTTGTAVDSFTRTADPMVSALTEPVEVPAQADEGLANATDGLAEGAEAPAQADEELANAGEAPANATDELATTPAEAPAQAVQGLDTATEAVSNNVTDLTDDNTVSPSTTAGTRRWSSGWKPGDGIHAAIGAIQQLFSGKTASSPTTGAPTSDASTTTDSETSSSTSSSSDSGSTP